MGVLNASLDSFSGEDVIVRSEAEAQRRGTALIEAGADLVDIGGASSHPGAKPVPTSTEWARLRPLVRALASSGVPFSCDTQNPEVAARCLDGGACLINDVSGAPAGTMASLAARYGVPLVITYNSRGHAPLSLSPEELRRAGSVELALTWRMATVMRTFFAERIREAAAERPLMLILDPGYGFGKTLSENLACLRAFPALGELRRPWLVCTSRKGSLGRWLGRSASWLGDAVGDPRLGASLASSLYGLRQGASLVRVHDVRPLAQFLRVWDAFARED